MDEVTLRIFQLVIMIIALLIMIVSWIDLRKGSTTAGSRVNPKKLTVEQARSVIMTRLLAGVSLIIGALLGSPLLTLPGFGMFILADVYALNLPKS
ncbi:MAG: hypothetical protein U0528_17645 [Anaerolineae bacterium]